MKSSSSVSSSSSSSPKEEDEGEGEGEARPQASDGDGARRLSFFPFPWGVSRTATTPTLRESVKGPSSWMRVEVLEEEEEEEEEELELFNSGEKEEEEAEGEEPRGGRWNAAAETPAPPLHRCLHATATSFPFSLSPNFKCGELPSLAACVRPAPATGFSVGATSLPRQPSGESSSLDLRPRERE
jgi:hypothetical protein